LLAATASRNSRTSRLWLHCIEYRQYPVAIDRFAEADECTTFAGDGEELRRDEVFVQAFTSRLTLLFYGPVREALQSFINCDICTNARDSGVFMPCATLDEAESTSSSTVQRRAALAMRAATSSGRWPSITTGEAMVFPSAWPQMQFASLRRVARLFRERARIFCCRKATANWIGLLELVSHRRCFLFLCHVLGKHKLWQARPRQRSSNSNTIERLFSRVLLLGRVGLALTTLQRQNGRPAILTALIKVYKMPLVLFPHHLLWCADCGSWIELKTPMHNTSRKGTGSLSNGFTMTTLRVTFGSRRNRSIRAWPPSLDRKEPRRST